MTYGPSSDPDLLSLLSPGDPVAFCREYLGRELLHSPGHACALAGLFGWDDLNHVLSTERLDPNRLKITREGKVVPFPLFAEHSPQLISSGSPRRLRTGLVADRLAQGDTLVIDSVEELHLPLRCFVQRLEQMLRCLVQVNVYVSAGATRGFGVHWDDHEVFALQIAGRKRWRVLGPTLRQPLLGIAPPPQPVADMAEAFDQVLQAGDILYLPRGWWHSVCAEGEPTIHLAVSGRLPQALDLVSTALNAAAASTELLRSDLPVHAPADVREAWLAAIAATLREVLSGPALAATPLWSDQPAVPPRPLSNLPVAVGGREIWEESAGRSLRLRNGQVDPGMLAGVLRLSTRGRGCARLCAGECTPIKDLLGELDSDDLAALTKAARQGVVELV